MPRKRKLPPGTTLRHHYNDSAQKKIVGVSIQNLPPGEAYRVCFSGVTKNDALDRVAEFETFNHNIAKNYSNFNERRKRAAEGNQALSIAWSKTWQISAPILSCILDGKSTAQKLLKNAVQLLLANRASAQTMTRWRTQLSASPKYSR